VILTKVHILEKPPLKETLYRAVGDGRLCSARPRKVCRDAQAEREHHDRGGRNVFGHRKRAPDVAVREDQPDVVRAYGVQDLPRARPDHRRRAIERRRRHRSDEDISETAADPGNRVHALRELYRLNVLHPENRS
jgi:hypothetical protein